MSHWALPYIGLPWVYGAAGPDAFDCWGFVRYVQEKHFAVHMPVIPHEGNPSNWREAADLLANHDERQNWEQVAIPQEGDCVLMARARLPVHIGVWVAANGTAGVLHCLQGQGVLFQAARALPAAGWGHLLYYRHKAPACTH